MFTNLIKIALAIAEDNRGKTRHQHVAFILKKKIVQVVGFNRQKTHPAILQHPYKDCTASIHAELNAIIRYGKTDCTDDVLVVMRFKKDGSLGNSNPCCGCRHVINQLRFKAVYYSNEFGGFSLL